MKYNVFTDFHHASLLYSFILLFEKRLGGNVFRPIGMDWATEGYWKVYDHPATQQQFLTLHQGFRPEDGTPALNQIKEQASMDQLFDIEGVYFCQDIDSGYYNKAITLSAFFLLPIDIVIASLPQHLEPFKKLCELHPNKPKLIYQIGNQWELFDINLVRNVMASAKINASYVSIDESPDVGLNLIEYHQEFDTHIFKPTPIISDVVKDERVITFPEKTIYSFVNVFQSFPDFPLFEQIEREMPDWSFKSYGGQCRDGAAHGSQELAWKMKNARFIWHTKAGGDGYGHVLHNAAAVSRPMIVKKSYYSGKLGDNLLIDGKTCIDIDNLTIQEIVDKIKYYNAPEQYIQMCENVYSNFKQVVDFDKEATQLEAFLARLQ